MKSTKLFLLFLVTGFMFKNAVAQTNASLNIVSANSGVVNQGSTLELTVTVTNTGSNPISAQRVRVQISVPSAVGLPLATGSQNALSSNWIVTSNTAGGVITICNNTDIIPASTTRTSIVKISANTIGSGQINAGLAFGNGTSCTAFGSLPGDNTGDNTSQTPMVVTAAVVPLTLTDFSATLKDCQPQLIWATESEINTDRFEIERSNVANSNDWKLIGTVAANGNSSSKINYSLNDKTSNGTPEKVFYRLKMIDNNGRFTYSNILPVLVNCKTGNLLVYPNPVHDGKLYVSLTGAVGYAEANLISTRGQIVLKSKMNNGTNYLNVSNIVDGVYILKINNKNGFEKTIKVSVMH
jgi:uncharacterized repeat protein (TIGR01451 family)